MSFVGKAIGSLTGANKQAKAAEKAAKTQAQSADKATQVQKEMYDQTRKDFDPFRQAGTNALSQMVGFNPGTYQGSQFNFNGTSNPNYSSAEFNFEESPSYQFRKEQGMDGIQSQAAAGGGLLSGATLKALNNYNSNLASQEYDNSYNQYLQGEQLKQGQHQQAFNNWQSMDNNNYSRFMTDQNNRYGRLADLVGIGQNAAAQQGQAGLSTGQAIANNTMAGANATAAGQIAAGNKTANNFGALLGVGNMVSNFYKPI
ncbi:DNA transfer protein p32 [Acinetobacter junii]|uniref:DNA transfer protein p32 n=1 Tax=Acinetobacter junii TaxID=40215 RepID=UPI001250C4C7|nr:DNA transfer protein p32 [Acinetobacter junii]